MLCCVFGTPGTGKTVPGKDRPGPSHTCADRKRPREHPRRTRQSPAPAGGACALGKGRPAPGLRAPQRLSVPLSFPALPGPRPIASKTIVTEAERTGHGLSPGASEGTRTRVRPRKPRAGRTPLVGVRSAGGPRRPRNERAGVLPVFVDPASIQQVRLQRRLTDKRNRPDQGPFMCRWCGGLAHADRHVSHDIATRGESVWNAGRESGVPLTP